ncbi:hypothetical protein D6833_08290 [Candidatus Parcubacteria bacterium]|nr:MAG: hypothetical protein D6833_08290 [Candidatus Parcubacteria bacterium]
MLVRAQSGEVSFTVSDLEIWGSARFPGEGNGECLITSFGDFDAWVRALDKGPVSIEWDGNSTRLCVAQGGDTCEFSVYPANNFPHPPDTEWRTVFWIDASLFKEAVRKTTFAASKDEARPALCAVYLEAELGGASFAAADSYRLAKYCPNAPVETQGQWLVSAQMLELAAKYAGTRVTLQVGEKCARIITGNLTYTAYLTDEKYPNYRQIIPDLETYPIQVVADRAALLKAVKRARKLDVEIVYLEIMGGLSLRAQNGDATARMRVSSVVHGGSLEIGFEPVYLEDVLRVLDGDVVNMYFVANRAPAVIQDTQYIYLIMPKGY